MCFIVVNNIAIHSSNSGKYHRYCCQYQMKKCDVCSTQVKNKEVGTGECPNCFEGILT